MKKFLILVLSLFLFSAPASLAFSTPQTPVPEDHPLPVREGRLLAGPDQSLTSGGGQTTPPVEESLKDAGPDQPAFGDESFPPIAEDLLARAAKMSPVEMIRVIVHLSRQPQDLVAEQVKTRHSAEMAAIGQRFDAINLRYAARRDTRALRDADNYGIPELVVSAADKEALAAVAEDHEALSLVIRDEITDRLAEAVEPEQQRVAALVEELLGTVEFTTRTVNALVAMVPVASINQLAADPGVAMITGDSVLRSHLNLAAEDMLVSVPGGLWDNLITGGTYDPAVVDTGCDLAHPFLANTAGRTNFHTYYLAAAFADPLFNDTLSYDDLYGHGTHVTGIVAGMGSVDYPTMLGMAHGVQKMVTLKSGWRTTTGEGLFYDTDTMYIVDRALYLSSQLTPAGTFNDDVDGLNCSFGSETYSDDNGFSRFFDSAVSSYPDLLVTIAAGNSGPDNIYFSTPADAYNPITVANIDDRGNASRINDVLYYSSTRGPTAAGRRKPDLAAPGTNIYSANNNWESQSQIANKTGTSMAAPMVQGVAMDLMNAGVPDELEIKALLINTAQKNEGNIDFEDDADGWDPGFGWGYLNALAAYHHRTDLFSGTVTPAPTAGHYRLYKGRMQDEGAGGEGRDRATLAWNRHVTYAPHTYPSTYYALSDLDLLLYGEANDAVIDYDSTTVDNVHQVRVGPGAGMTDVVLKVTAYNTAFAHGGATESFALATEENFVESALPTAFQANGLWPSEMEPNEVAPFQFWITNFSDLASHNNRIDLGLPAGWALLSGSDPASVGSAPGGDGESNTATWTLRAQPTVQDGVDLGLAHSHLSYGENWGPFTWHAYTNVRWDTTPPSPNPMGWLYSPSAAAGGSLSMTCLTATDRHNPVNYYFDVYASLDGGYGGTDSGWQTGTAYTDTGLDPNCRYQYRVMARDSAQTPNMTTYSSIATGCSLAVTPGTPEVGNASSTTLDMTVSPAANPAWTEFAIRITDMGAGGLTWYLNAGGGSNGGTPFWQTASAWDVLTAQGLRSGTLHRVSVVARNQYGVLTNWSAYGYGTTTLPLVDTISTLYYCEPASGTVPFSTTMTVKLENLYAGQMRRIAARIDVSLANGTQYSSWRAGFTNVGPSDGFTTTWVQAFPALGSLIGENLFRVKAEDVTPTPYNQPPYPPAGDTATAGCLVTAFAP